ncbi:radical SAM protein [Megalodesulfovibrio gigas]|uniref:Putative Radical SAM domain protein n=1 Tax=Megalodesulfovibrio gigas (strain ATCC 19364 / DSM 1382 / NCIMB 9332 / VKM B-1759) TaxID=1121448 RepID=T2GCS3_MEGG1|nr:radical SAM protein [Megalodesulfovibrio gigas]AGW14078.1 putative Radical SAM domain protein [Megalodesulfovibrio gigas DSM 1382 = ATCC 19364]
MATAPFHLMWNMTRRCNFQCRYCYFPHEAAPVEPVVPAGVLLDFLDATGEEWVVGMTGGEPFLYPDFVDLCHELSLRHRISIDTNLSISRLVRDFADRVDPARVHDLYIALHIEERRRKGLVDAFVEDIRLLLERGFHLTVNYVVHPQLVPEFRKDREWFGARGVPITPRPFKGFFDGQEYPNAYNAEARAVFAEFPRAGRKMAFNFQGVPCRGGRTLLRLEPDGQLYRCSGEKRDLGNMLTTPRRLDTDEPCRARRCPCLGPNYVLLSPAQDALLAGLQAMVTGNSTAAREQFLIALSLDPELPAAANNLGVLDWEAGAHEAARARFVQALALDPGADLFVGNLAAALAAHGEHLRAKEMVQRQMDPAWQTILTPLARQLARGEETVGWPRLCVDFVPEHRREAMGIPFRLPVRPGIDME